MYAVPNFINGEPYIEGESYHADPDIPRAIGFDPRSGRGRFEPSAKLRARIEKLAHWRIDRSSIIFPEDACEFHGGHATVSKARIKIQDSQRWWEDEIDVAVKKVRIADNTDLQRVLGLAVREAEFLDELSHPKITEFQGFVEDVSNGVIWLVFPWAHHGNLKDFVSSVAWEIPERISLIYDVAQGVAYLHSREPPIRHGDLKSLNVLVNKDRHARITDFGSARRLPQRNPNWQAEQIESQPPPPQLLNATFCASTNTITLTGNQYSLRWAAPELLNEDELSLGSDIWALGWIAYEVMTNSIPFQDAKSDMVLVKRVLEGELPSLTDNAHLSLIHELCSLMNMCWKNDPAERPTADYCRQSIQQMPMFPPELNTSLISDARADRSFTVDRLRDLGQLYLSRGEHVAAFRFFVKGLEDPKMHGEPEMLISGLSNLAQLHRLRNEYSESIVLCSEVPGYCVRSNSEENEVEGPADGPRIQAQLTRPQNGYSNAIKPDPGDWEFWEEEGLATILSNLSDVRRLKNGYDQASETPNLSDRKGRAQALWSIAELHRLQHQYNKALPFYYEALKIRTGLDDKDGRASVQWSLAQVHRLQKQYDEAIRLYTEISEIHTDLGDRKGRADALWGLAQVHRLKTQYDDAIRLYRETLEIRTELDDKKGKADALWGLAQVHQLQSQYSEAIVLYYAALQIRTELGDREGEAHALWALAEVYRLRSEYNEATRHYSEALLSCMKINDRRGQAAALLGLADVHHDQERWDDAKSLYQQVFKLLQDLGNKAMPLL